MPAPLSVLMVTSEAHPFAKTGGLAEVSASLSDALGALGHTVTLVLPRYRSVAVDGAERLQTRMRLGDRLQPVGVLRAPALGQGDGRARRRARALRPRRDLRHRRGRLFGQRPAVRRVQPRGARVPAAARAAAVDYSRPRLADGPRAGLPEDALVERPVRRRGAGRVHGAQPRVSGRVSRLDFARDRARLRSARRAGSRVLGQHQLPQGRHQLQREDHDRQPGLRQGNRPVRARLRLRGRPCPAIRRPRGDSQRHRHRALDAVGRCLRTGVVHRRRSRRKARGQTRAARHGETAV